MTVAAQSAPGHKRRQKILAVASAGGHWAELLRLRPVFDGSEVVFVTTDQENCDGIDKHLLHFVPDANQNTKIQLLLLAVRMLIIVIRLRPDVVISTGAAPGYFALRFGKFLGARTLWLDSIANSEEPSLSMKLVRPYADVVLTQWPNLAKPEGPFYRGTIL